MEDLSSFENNKAVSKSLRNISIDWLIDWLMDAILAVFLPFNVGDREVIS